MVTVPRSGFRLKTLLCAGMVALVSVWTQAMAAGRAAVMQASAVSPEVSGSEAAWVVQAESGDARAKMKLGLRYAMGRGVPADDAKAQKWLREAAMTGNAVAQVSLATMMAFESDEQDVRGAFVWYGKAASQGNMQAQTELARMLEAGLGVPRNPEEAEAWRRQAKERADEVMLAWTWKIAATGSEYWQVAAPVPAPGKSLPKGVATGIDTPLHVGICLDVNSVGRALENGDVVARTVGAMLLATGNGVKKDEALAVLWFTRAAEAGYPQAQATLGELYMLGWGPLEADQEAAAGWMRRAAEGGLREAKTSYGSMLAGGKGVKENRKEAFVWIRSAAEANEARAQLMMAMNALAKDDREGAAQWFYRAAENGDDEVLSMLGVLYGWGDAAVAGESEKVTEVRRYAQRGEPEAQLMLGLLFGEGWGTARDTVRAEQWFSTAASQHYADVWLPLGLLYAETGRLDKAQSAFDTAVRLNALSFARDQGILQLLFIESEKMPELDVSLLSEKAREVKAVRKKTNGDVTEQDSTAVKDGIVLQRGQAEVESAGRDGAVTDLRQERIARKIAFLGDMTALGNPAAEIILATLLEQGWSVPRDVEMAGRLRALAREKICAVPRDAEENEPDCVSPDGVGGTEEGMPSDEGADAAPRDGKQEDDGLAMKVTDYSTGGGI